MTNVPRAGSFLEGDHTEYCDTCEDYAEVDKTIVTDGRHHDVFMFELDCGHDRLTNHISLSDVLVEKLQDQRPADIEVRAVPTAE